MTAPSLHYRALAGALILAVATTISAPYALAQSAEADENAREGEGRAASARAARERSAARATRNKVAEPAQQKKTESYPEATRKSPEARATAKGTTKLQKLIKAQEDSKGEDALALAEGVMSDDRANAYERAFAAQLAAQVAYEAGDHDATMAYLNKAITLDGLDNNGHFAAMLMLAQLQLQQDQYADALATFDRFFSETRSSQPEHLVLKGNALYRLKRYPEAIAVLRQALEKAPQARSDWQQLLMAAYAESGQAAEASALAEDVASKAPSDKRAQLNLAATYLQTSNYVKAAEVLERMRTAGLLTEERDYRQLYATYLNLEGKEAQAASVIDEGLKKGVLKPDFDTYVALAQAYYFSEQIDKAIDAYTQAAPLDDDGGTYLNLARALWAADRVAEAKQAAQRAIEKGVNKPEEAKRILALPNK